MEREHKPDASRETKPPPSRQTLRGLDWFNFLLADVQTGVGPFLAIYLAGSGRLVVLGLWAAPVIVVATALTLALTFALVR